MTASSRPQRLDTRVWDPLLEGLASFFWYKGDLHRFLVTELRDAPELLAGIDLSRNSEMSKREAAGVLVERLQQHEARYQPVVIQLLVRLAGFDDRFARLHEQAPDRVERARATLRELQALTAAYSKEAKELEQRRAELAAESARAESARSHASELAALHARFMTMFSDSNPQARGREFERLLNEAFALWDLMPRAAYNNDHEQVDGAFTYDTDEYLLEARWWKDPLQPKELNDFKVKVDKKAKNTLGLCVAVNGFTDGAIAEHSHSTPLILMDGLDLIAILEQRIQLPRLLTAKKRHAAETGQPFLRVADMDL